MAKTMTLISRTPHGKLEDILCLVVQDCADEPQTCVLSVACVA